MVLLALLVGLIACAGLAQAILGYLAVWRFQAATPDPETARPPVTMLKPLHGDEPLLEAALASLCAQTYPDYQIVFGVQNAHDTAIAVVDRLRQRFPQRDISLVIDPTPHGANHKVANLINMFPSAKHDILVIADSDVHATPDYIEALVRTLAVPGTGLATTLYGGIVATPSLAAALGATWINHSFLPGALMARWLGRQDCLGATMALRRETLDAIGGLQGLADHLADDNVLGALVRDQGLRVRIAGAVVSTTVPETSLGALFRHELRWARTILALVPVEFALSSIQFPLFWSGLAIALSGAATWSIGLFLAAWTVRAMTARGVDKMLGRANCALATPAPIWLFPLRDLISMTVILASYGSDRVEWRGQVLHTGRTQADDETYSDATGADAPQAITLQGIQR